MIDDVLEWLRLASTVLAALAVPFLVVAAARQVRQRRTLTLAPPSLAAIVSMAAVVLVTLAAVLGAVIFEVPTGFTPLSVVLAVAAAVLLWRDERFWVALGLLGAVYTTIGITILAALSHNIRMLPTEEMTEEGLFFGGRQLVAWGGINANPTYDRWELALVSLAVLRYGLPLALSVTISWLVATRADLTRLQRTGLLLSLGSILSGVVGGAAMMIVFLEGGVLLGIPIAIGVVGTIGSLFTLFTVGPGSIDAFTSGLRGPGGKVAGASDVIPLVTALADRGAPPEPPPWAAHLPPPPPDPPVHRALSWYLRGRVGRVQRIVAGLLAALFVVLVVLGPSGLVYEGGERVAVQFQHVLDQRPIGFTVAASFPAPDDTRWLVGEQGEVARFDPADGSVERVGVVVDAAAAGEDGALVALVSDPEQGIVRVSPDGEVTEVVASTGLDADHLAVLDDGFVVATSEGRIVSLDESGVLRADVTGEEVLGVVSVQGELWTLHPSSLDDMGDGVRRDPLTLGEQERDSVFFEGTVVRWAERDDATGQSRIDTARGAVMTWMSAADPLGPPVVDAPGRWTPVPSELGALDGPDGRLHFHYDTVVDAIETDDGVWLVADNDAGTVVGVDDVVGGFVVLWRP